MGFVGAMAFVGRAIEAVQGIKSPQVPSRICRQCLLWCVQDLLKFYNPRSWLLPAVFLQVEKAKSK